ncbi:MAG: hypothetical protein JWN22_3821 [Nocardioides sp.]|nr:hypothetical protein [Nocardioides sp.]
MSAASLPRHVGLVMDGNRRWARAAGHVDPSVGHRYGAEHVRQILGWCSRRGIAHLSIYVLSADNIRKRQGPELDQLFDLLASTLPDIVRQSAGDWSLHVSGDLSLLPERSRDALVRAVEDTRGRSAHLTLAIGYDGRQDVVHGIRTALLASHGSPIDVDTITAHLAGGPLKEIDLVIRTSGEQRLSGFFPWQASDAEIHVSTKMWPAFTERDFARALADYASRRARRTGA